MRSSERETAPLSSVMCPMETHSKVTLKPRREHSFGLLAPFQLNREVASKRNTLKTITAQRKQKQLDGIKVFDALF